MSSFQFACQGAFAFRRLPLRRLSRSRFELEAALDARKVLAGCLLPFITQFSAPTLPFNRPPEALAATSEVRLFDEVWGIVNENFVDDTFNGNDWRKIKEDYSDKLARGADEHALLQKMLSLLGDKYTRLVEKSTFEGLWKYDAIGVGLLFQSDPGKTMVIAGPPISNSAGEKAGLQKGDFVFSINGKSTTGMTAMNLLDMMSNDESDTVTIEYGRGGGGGGGGGEVVEGAEDVKGVEHKSVTLKRSKQKAVNPISYSSQRLPNGKLAGYIKFSDFNAEAVPGLRAALDDLNKQGVDEILLDLRGNTGGGFQFALNVGGMFMQDKEMATALGKGGERNVFRTSYPEGVVYTKPLLVMTDGLSASASEVLTGGLHDNCRAVTVGANSFGKGKIQAVFGLSNGEGLIMTVAQYVTPRGTVIQSKGLTPDMPDSKVGNAYFGAAIGSLGIAPTPDLASIDFDRAEVIRKGCLAEVSP